MKLTKKQMYIMHAITILIFIYGIYIVLKYESTIGLGIMIVGSMASVSLFSYGNKLEAEE
jgi:uncharacterized membrane protein